MYRLTRPGRMSGHPTLLLTIGGVVPSQHRQLVWLDGIIKLENRVVSISLVGVGDCSQGSSQREY
jgi:hypothetical protein